ncbi:MAG: hypothetical protein K5686_12125 [Lachnospiraceae bacterium]|nr:hypothetical protein [Lachnospiraceae bacterium]
MPKTYILMILVTVFVIAGGFFIFGGNIEKGIKKSYRERITTDGSFTLEHEPSEQLLYAFGKEGITLYAQDECRYAWKYREEPESEEKERDEAKVLQRKLTILSLTGGLTDDALEAELAESNKGQWQAYLDEMQDMAEDLKQKREELEARQDESERKAEPYVLENGELQKEAVKIQSIREGLMKEIFAYLISTGAIRDYTEIENNGNELSPEVLALLPADLRGRAAALQERADELQAKYDELDRKYSYLDNESDELESETEAFHEEEQKLEESEAQIKETKEKLKELEAYEADKNTLVSFVPVYETEEFVSISKKIKNLRSISAGLLVLAIAGIIITVMRSRR